MISKHTLYIFTHPFEFPIIDKFIHVSTENPRVTPGEQQEP